MRSKVVQQLLRALIALLGAGVGAGLTATVQQLLAQTNLSYHMPVKTLVIVYISVCALGGLIGFLLSNRMLRWFVDWGNRLEQRMERMPIGQMFSSVTGLICGLIIAALLSQILNFVGASLFTTAISAILYVIFGALGLSIGFKRARDIVDMQDRLYGFRERRALRKSARQARESAEEDGDGEDAAGQAQAKILDTSVIIDGRIFAVARTGFLEGEMVVPQFVLDELRRVADSADAQRRSRGRRGLDLLQKARQEPGMRLRVDPTDWQDTEETDVKLLRLARETGGRVVTNDFNLNKVAAVSGMKVLNLNDLAGALKPAVLAGEELETTITKEGKEPGQGVGYMEDGTMIVVEGGRRHVGETVQVVVTTVIQTSAGRMIFSRLKEEKES